MIVRISESPKKDKDTIKINSIIGIWSHIARIPLVAQIKVSTKLTKVQNLDAARTFFFSCSSPLKAKGPKHGSITSAGHRVISLRVILKPKWNRKSDDCCKSEINW